MKKLSILFTLFVCYQLTAQQTNTEIFLFDLSIENGKYNFTNGKNISNNEGYDNQPSFINDNKIIFASSRKGQTDIAQYYANYDSKSWLNFTEGGEYTPLKIPNKKAVSAVRLDKDGKQRLYEYSLRNGENTELVKDLVVAYYTWFNNNIIVAAVIEDKALNLFVIDVKNGTHKKYANNVGRSFHKIPNSNLVSFISKENKEQWQIKSIDPLTGTIKNITNTLPNVEDMCWLINGDIIMGKESQLYKLRVGVDSNWKEIANLSSYGISKITRITSNEISNKFLIAATIGETSTNTEETNTNTNSETTKVDAAAIVQKHIEPFNKADLEGFANAFTKNIIVNNFPDKRISKGKQELKQSYERFFKNNTNLSVLVNNRIVLNKFVIDEELVTVNKKTIRQATVYTTSNNGIESMTFIQNRNSTTNPEIIVNKQLEAYNKRDINAFMATYSKDIKLYNYPNKVFIENQQAMRKGYATMFSNTKDLNATIKKRIVIGNKVIDEEQITANGKTFKAIAIYEVENGLISKVTYIR